MTSRAQGRVTTEIDLRGQDSIEAIMNVDNFLDHAVLMGINQVAIIHGKGTMILRKKIQEYLKKSKYIAEFRDANQNEGGLGCTVAKLK
mgnify:CR=1 FL=1